MKLEPWRLAVVIICVAILLGGGADALFSFGSLGYTVGHEGVKASFVGIEWNTVGEKDNSGKKGLTGMSFYFDADDRNKYAPNIVGEMTNAFVPKESVKPSWVFDELWSGTQYIQNPIDEYEWDLPNPDVPNETIVYHMEEWILRMYVSITAEWDKSSSRLKSEKEEYGHTRYQDTSVWIELDLSPIWYFEGSDQVYFGLAKVQCSGYAEGRLGKTDDDYTPTSEMSVSPTESSYRYLYRQKYAKEQVTPTDPKTYKGRVLNPDIFTDKMFIKLDLNYFGTHSYQDMFGAKYSKGDAVTWAFDVHVFVVGEWKVKDIAEIPEDYGRTPMTEYGWTYYLAKMLGDPRTQFWLILGMIAIVGLFLAVFAPWVLIAIFGMISAFRGRGGSKKK